jgi:ElaB/YqjD/DUF883 family membrane-anchored ribosome-binding protein
MISMLVDHPRQVGLDYLKSFVSRFHSMLEEVLDEHRETALKELEAARRAQRQHEIIEKNCTQLRNDFASLRSKIDSIRNEFAENPAEDESVIENKDSDEVEKES